MQHFWRRWNKGGIARMAGLACLPGAAGLACLSSSSGIADLLSLARLASLAGILLASAPASAQVVDFGQNPPSLHWRQIQTPHFQLIFPDSFARQAQHMRGILEKAYGFENYSLRVATQPIPIIFQTQPAESNAFVILSPRRSEFFTLPPQDLEPSDWLTSLAVHEMRHVAQIDRVFNGKGSPPFETIQLALFGLIYPAWFFEGDAVGMETALTHTGRGRLPSWEVDLRANILSGKDYSYSKYSLGSLRDNVPDYYRIGYFMVSKIRRDYGDSVFNKIYTGALRFRAYPLSRSLKENTGLNTGEFFHKTMAELKQVWSLNESLSPKRGYASLNQRTDSISSQYYQPQRVDRDRVVVLKKGLDQLPGIYCLNTRTRTEQKILTIGRQSVPHFNYTHHLLVWDEWRTDPRFQYRSYSDIFLYDWTNGAKRRITSRTKLFSPSLRPDGLQIVAVEVHENYTFNLVILETHSGKIMRRIPNPGHYFFETPAFDSAGQRIVCTAVSAVGKAIYQYDLLHSAESVLKPFGYTEITRPVYGPGGTIIYHSAQTGLDQLFYWNPGTAEGGALTAAQFGAYSPHVSGDEVLFEAFSPLGRNVARLSLTQALKSPQDTVRRLVGYYQPLISQEKGGRFFPMTPPLDSLGDSALSPVKPFREWTHLFYFHSLLPDVQNVNVSTNTFLAGLKLRSTNLLNTTQLYAGLYYQNGVNSLQYQAGITYKRFFPELTVSFTDQKRNALAIRRDSIGTVFIPYSYRSRLLNFGIMVPLNFTNSRESFSLNAQVSTSFQNNYALSIPLSRFKNFNTYILFPLHYSFIFQKNRLQAARDILPSWGQNISLDFENLPFSTNLKGQYFALNSGFYFPGFARHHVLRLGFNYQFSEGVYQGQRQIDQISGFATLPPTNLKNTLLVNYSFPIAYPDWELGRVAYVRKLIGGLFYNQQNTGSTNPNFATATTYGLQFRADFNLLRFYLPVFQLGTKAIFFEDKALGGPKFELVFNYSL